MCTIHNIRLLNLILSCLKAIFALYIFGIGVTFSQDVLILQSFGTVFAQYGGGLAVLGMMSGFIIPVHVYAVKRHNRYLCVVSFVIDTIVLGLLVMLGLNIGSFEVSPFPIALQQDCSLSSPQIYWPNVCQEYYDSDRTAGFRLAWEYLYADRNNTASFQILSTLEARVCCGFGAPFSCVPNNDPFPSNRPLTGIPAYQRNHRVVCGPKPNYYPKQRDCWDYYDPAAIPPILGGCVYDMGLGFCIESAVTGSTAGCSALMEAYMVSQISPHAFLLIACSAFNGLAMLIACCMFWKRKEPDVFPEFRAPHVPVRADCSVLLSAVGVLYVYVMSVCVAHSHVRERARAVQHHPARGGAEDQGLRAAQGG